MSQQVQILFAFADRLLRYDCGSCSRPCCKTGSLALLPAEHSAIIARNPALELVSPAPGTGIELMATPTSGCWFLDDASDAPCTLVAAASPRPAACSLFPFNIFALYDGMLVVAPNALCPLSTDPGQGIAHDQVAAQLAELGAAGEPPSPTRSNDPAGAARLEQLICHTAGASLHEESPIPLVAFAELVTRAFLRDGVGGLENESLADLDAVVDDMWQQFEELADLIAVPLPPAESLAAVTPLLAAWTPSIRLLGLDRVPLSHLPRGCLALALYASHWQSLRPEQPLLPQALSQMVSALAPLLALLASWHQPWAGGAALTCGSMVLEPNMPPAELTSQLADDPWLRTAQLRALAEATIWDPTREPT